jgi:thiol-disulfide isomerase/thioredoxin
MEQAIELYHADWCGHCKRFIPIWEGMKKEFGGKGISFADFEHSKNESIMKKKNIHSFPTIHFKYGEYGATYSGPRNPDDILSQYEMFKQMSTEMKGGKRGETVNNYKSKYLKYKTKYLKEKRNRK